MEQTPKSAILTTLASIPPGKVSSYGEIAKRAGYPGMARYVAMILKQLPEDTRIPWHRVVNHKARSSFAQDSPLYRKQISLLKAEGVNFSKNNTISKQHIW